MVLTEEKIVELYNKYKDLFNPQELVGKKIEKSGHYSTDDSIVLYSVIRFLKPSKILEMSPETGWTTLIMLEAIRDEEFKCDIISYDLKEESNQFNVNEEYASRIFVKGNIKNTFKVNDIKECNFILMDADHHKDFAEWYSENVLFHLKKNAVIFIHDWPGYSDDYGSHMGRSGKTNEPGSVKKHFIREGYGVHITNTKDLGLSGYTEIIYRTNRS